MALTDNLVSYYKLDSNSTDIVSANNGTDTDISYATAGKIGNCATFDGNDKILLGTGTLAPLLNGASAITFGGWVKVDSVTGSNQIIMLFNIRSVSDDQWTCAMIRINATTGAIVIGGRSVYTESFESLVGAAVTTGSFQHIIGVLDFANDKIYLYINGVLSSSATVTFDNSAFTDSTTHYFGDTLGYYHFTSDSEYLTGSLDEIGIWSRALSADEVSQLYNSNRALAYPLTAPNLYGAVAYYKLDEASGNADDSVGTNDLVNAGVTFAAGKINNGAVFDGGGSTILEAGSNIGVTGASARTINFWSKVAVDYSGGDGLVGWGPFSSAGDTFFVLWNAPAHTYYFAGNSKDEVFDTEINDGAWHMCTVTFDGTTVNKYVDGAFDSDYVPASLSTTDGKLTVGARSGGTSEIVGMVDEVCIFNRVLTSAEIASLYNSGTGLQYPFTSSNTSNFFMFF